MNMPPHALEDPARATEGGGVRRAARTNLYLAATLVGENMRLAVTVRNLSATGALVRAPVALEKAGRVRLLRGSRSVAGRLAWFEGRNGGMRFDAPIDLADWTPGATGQRDVDRMVALSRGQVAPLARPRASEVPVEERRAVIVARIAEEIADAERRLEGVGSQLADDPAIVARYAAQMQELDITAQLLGHLARLLDCDAPEERVAAIGMADLRRRLEASAA